ncbi:MAG: NADH:ubiquinone oxidoreductase subunit NDUFA12 [Rhodobacteraceae bacterium]|nr:NADH:ubiquinone oxidoreductase subunit NDUFA12 [Paracoccaceae bacterium]
MKLVKHMITWWDSQTLGTRIFTWLRGVRVGEDEDGNIYYSTADGQRRWVIYNGPIEASRVSPEWHGWLHHTFANPPSDDPLPRYTWQAPHVENLTGTEGAYVPPGSLRNPERRRRADYEAWDPDAEGGAG